MTVLEPGQERVTKCHECGEIHVRIGTHWGHPDVSFSPPDLTTRQMEIIRGLCLGDGCLVESQENARMEVTNTNLDFLEWLSGEFGPMSTGVRLKEDSKTQASYQGGKACDYKDVYRLRLRSHPVFTRLRKKWYKEEGIRFPRGLKLTPMSVKVWYSSDGNVRWRHGKYPGIRITSKNEMDRADFIKGLFEDIGFEATYTSNDIRIPSRQREGFLEYLGDPIPGFQYKWAVHDRDEYDRLKP